MLVYLYNTHLFYATQYKIVHWRIKKAATAAAQGSFLYTNTALGEVGVVRERGRTADDRVIKAELHPPHQAGRRATVRPSTLLRMTWASKNWPCVHPYSQ